MIATTEDAFLGGRLKITQPKQGYRAATDPVFLAAATPANSGQSVLELGCGVGTASICLGHRVPNLELMGIEIQAQYAALARENFTANGIAGTILEGDVEAMPDDLRAMSFDCVMANPPFFAAHAHTPSPYQGKDLANRAEDPVAWIDAGLKRLKPGGWLTLIHRTEHLADVLVALKVRAGDIAIKPLAARVRKPANRVLLKAKKASKGPLTLHPPFIIHCGEKHVDGPEGYTDEAQAVLRTGKSLEF